MNRMLVPPAKGLLAAPSIKTSKLEGFMVTAEVVVFRTVNRRYPVNGLGVETVTLRRSQEPLGRALSSPGETAMMTSCVVTLYFFTLLIITAKTGVRITTANKITRRILRLRRAANLE